jgi:hypothetical protein
VNQRDTLVAMVLAAAVAALRPEPIMGQTLDPWAVPKSIYHSETVLHDALANIAQMQEPELRAFTRYLAECKDDEDSNISKHACSAALASYEIEFGKDALNHERPLDELILVRSGLASRTPEDRARDPEERARALRADPKEIADWAVREVKIPIALAEAARARFRSLKSAK